MTSELRVGRLLHGRDEWTKVKGHAGSEGSEQRLREEKAQGLDGMFQSLAWDMHEAGNCTGKLNN